MAEPFATFTSRVIPLPAENVDTDQIVPARYLKVTDKAGLAEALFRDWRFEEDGSLREPRFVLDQPEMAGRQILLAGDNFGAGSSREHAPWALTAWGIRAILSTSFADIFRNNALKNGLLPIVVEPDQHRHLFELVAADPDTELTVDLEAQVVHLPGDEDLPFDVDPFAKMMLLAGTDELGYLLGKTAGDRRLGGGPPRPRRHGRGRLTAARADGRRNPSLDDRRLAAMTDDPRPTASASVIALVAVALTSTIAACSSAGASAPPGSPSTAPPAPIGAAGRPTRPRRQRRQPVATRARAAAADGDRHDRRPEAGHDQPPSGLGREDRAVDRRPARHRQADLDERRRALLRPRLGHRRRGTATTSSLTVVEGAAEAGRDLHRDRPAEGDDRRPRRARARRLHDRGHRQRHPAGHDHGQSDRSRSATIDREPVPPRGAGSSILDAVNLFDLVVDRPGRRRRRRSASAPAPSPSSSASPARSSAASSRSLLLPYLEDPLAPGRRRSSGRSSSSAGSCSRRHRRGDRVGDRPDGGDACSARASSGRSTGSSARVVGGAQALLVDLADRRPARRGPEPDARQPGPDLVLRPRPRRLPARPRPRSRPRSARLLDDTGLPDLFVGLEPLPAPPVTLPDDPLVEQLAATAQPSTVKVSRRDVPRDLDRGRASSSSRGYVVTNAHVVAGASTVRVAVGGDVVRRGAGAVRPRPRHRAAVRAAARRRRRCRFAPTDPSRGATGATFGFPGGGGLDVRAGGGRRRVPGPGPRHLRRASA